MRSFGILTVYLVLLFLITGCGLAGAPQSIDWRSPYRDISALEEGVIVHLPTGVTVTKDQLFDTAGNTKIVYVGETHDNLNAHKVQLEILRTLQARRPGGIAVGMEMLKRPSQAIADQWSAGKLDEKELVRTWVKDWTNDFEYYRDILEYIRDNRIPLLALRASDDWLKRLTKHNTPEAHVQEEQEEEPLPAMDDQDVYHRSHTRAIFSKHPGSSLNFDDFYKVQVLWDESMAQSIHEYLSTEKGRDKQILIFAGTQHVEHGYGIPRRMFRRRPAPYLIVLPVVTKDSTQPKQKTMAVSLPAVPLLSGDFAWGVSYKNLEDRKVRLGVIVNESQAGLQIIEITKDSAAEKAGLAKEDLIKTFDGEPIETLFDLTYLIGLKIPGDKGVVEVLRDKQALSFEVTFVAGTHGKH